MGSGITSMMSGLAGTSGGNSGGSSGGKFDNWK